MITWTQTDLTRALLSALSGSHGDCGGDAVNCSTCLLMAEARLYLKANDTPAPDRTGPVSWADQWDEQTGGKTHKARVKP